MSGLKSLRTRALIVAATAAAVTCALMAHPAAARASGPGYLTLLFGGTQVVATDRNCQPLPNAVTLGTMADLLHQRGLSGTGAVVVDRTNPSASNYYCESHQYLVAAWDTLSWLHGGYGWNFVSNGQTHHNITRMSPSQQWQESCGSLSAFSSHGLPGAWGLFAYGDDFSNPTVQANVVSRCFSYGRDYSSGVNPRSSLRPPWFQRTFSTNGGRCADASAPCHNVPMHIVRSYTDPNLLVSLAQVQPDSWNVIQVYRFVQGSNLTGAGPHWDCTAPSWTDHWVDVGELYCVNDYVYMLDHIGAGVVVTDPATVATAWGRGF